MNAFVEPVVAGALLGLANAAHCAGMCGVFALRAAAAPRRVGGFVAYGLGKTFSYVVLGAVAGALGGKLLRNAGVAQAWAAAGAGALLLVAGGWKIAAVVRARRAAAAAAAGIAAAPPAAAGAPSGVVAAVGALLRSDLPGGRFTLGALTGLLPCGVVYLAALQGAALGGPARAVALMAGFGLGTLPVLAGVGTLGGALRGRFGPRTLQLAGGALLLATGAVVLGRAVLTLAAGRPSCCH